MTAPWAADSAAVIAQSHGQVIRARADHPSWAAPVELDVEDVRVTFEERRAPRAAATLTVTLPDLTLADLLDPRAGVRVLVDAGYVRPGGVEDVQPLVNLGLRRVEPDHAAGTLTLEAAGDESLLIDAAPTANAVLTGSSHADAIATLINYAISPPPMFLPAVTGDPVTIDPMTDRWDTAQDLADRLGAQLYDDGLRAWHLDPTASTLTADPSLDLTVGEGGTILSSRPTLDRDAWHNYVLLRYRWRDTAGTDQQVMATAYLADGPFAVTGPTGRRIMLDEREVPTTQAVANAAAAAVLARAQTRARTCTVEAIAAYWLRPGHTVTLRTHPDLPAEVHLVQSVTFRPMDGLMDVQTRIPDPATAATATP